MASERVDLHGVPTPVDRRKQRIHLPSCEACRSPKTAVATRTEYVVYVRCAACGLSGACRNLAARRPAADTAARRVKLSALELSDSLIQGRVGSVHVRP